MVVGKKIHKLVLPVPCRTLMSSNDNISPVPSGSGTLQVCCWGTSRGCIKPSLGKSLATISPLGVAPVHPQPKPFLNCPRVPTWSQVSAQAPPPASLLWDHATGSSAHSSRQLFLYRWPPLDHFMFCIFLNYIVLWSLLPKWVTFSFSVSYSRYQSFCNHLSEH